MLGLRQIEVLRAFMRTGTVKGAADLLNVTQPGVSRTLRHIEDSLGVQLFRRARGRLVATAELEYLSAEIESAWEHVARIEKVAANLRSGLPTLLRIGGSPSFGASILPGAVAALQARRPDLRYAIEIAAPDDLVERLVTRQLDVVYTLSPVAHPALVVEPVAVSRMVCVMPPDHPLAAQSVVAADDLAAHAFISFPSDSAEGEAIASAFAGIGDAPRVDIAVRSTATACWFVRAGAGVALVDTLALRGEAFPGLAHRPFLPEIAFRLSACTCAAAAVSDAASALTRQVKMMLEARARD